MKLILTECADQQIRSDIAHFAEYSGSARIERLRQPAHIGTYALPGPSKRTAYIAGYESQVSRAPATDTIDSIVLVISRVLGSSRRKFLSSDPSALK